MKCVAATTCTAHLHANPIGLIIDAKAHENGIHMYPGIVTDVKKNVTGTQSFSWRVITQNTHIFPGELEFMSREKFRSSQNPGQYVQPFNILRFSRRIRAFLCLQTNHKKLIYF